MTRTEKIILASTATILLSSIVIMTSTKKYENAATRIVSELNDINYQLSRNREDIISGNVQIVAGNRMLRELVKKSISQNTPTK